MEIISRDFEITRMDCHYDHDNDIIVDKSEVRNDHKHSQTCAKNRKKRKSKRKNR